ncbi:MAG: UDP-3-O-(3-hydroxymyristoyl)glucosamine N-acyltransferase [Planctomycetes bacterium]|nr:UDP-3-O-(3-hydroxymyristoyl)glucosamine N-acyltransferase [Planctomycetota bacterium]
MTSAPASAKTLTATEIASMLGGELVGDSDALFGQVQDIKNAQSNEVAFFKSAPNEMGQHPSEEEFQAMRNSDAGLMIVDKNCPSPPACHIKLDNPALGATLLAQFWQSRRRHCAPGVHPSAVIEDGAQIADSAHVGPLCVVGKNSVVGENCILYPGVVLYENVHLGDGCVINANTTIGCDGFGYTWSGSEHSHMPQIGGVRVGRGVEMGSGCTIDAGTFQPTLIGDGCIFDNQVHLAHNVNIGRFVILCGQVGISGSAVIGDGAVFAGQSGAGGHLHVGAQAIVTARAAVMSDVEPGQTVAGQPAVDIKLHQRMMAIVRSNARR